MRSRRSWPIRASVTAVSAVALVALAAPAEATAPASPAAAPVAAATAAADVDYDTWQRDCRAVMDQALPYLKQRIGDTEPGEKQAIVLDVDNTALETDFGFSFPQPANEPVLEVAEYAQEHGVNQVYFECDQAISELENARATPVSASFDATEVAPTDSVFAPADLAEIRDGVGALRKELAPV